MKKKLIIIPVLGIAAAASVITPLVSCSKQNQGEKYCTITFTGGDGVIIPSNLPTLSAKQGTTLADFILGSQGPRIEIQNWYKFDGYYVNNQKVNAHTYKFESDSVTIEVRANQYNYHSVQIVRKAIESCVKTIDVKLKSGGQEIPQPTPGEISFSKTNAADGFQMITTITLDDTSGIVVDNYDFDLDTIYLQNSTDETNYHVLKKGSDYTIENSRTSDKTMVITVTFAKNKALWDIRANLFVSKKTSIVMDSSADSSDYVWSFSPAIVDVDAWKSTSAVREVTLKPNYEAMGISGETDEWIDFSGLNISVVGFEVAGSSTPNITPLKGYFNTTEIPADADFTYKFNGDQGQNKAIIVTYTLKGWQTIASLFEHFNEQGKGRGGCYLEYSPISESGHGGGGDSGDSDPTTDPWEQFIRYGDDESSFNILTNPFNYEGWSGQDVSVYDGYKSPANCFLSIEHDKILLSDPNAVAPTPIGNWCSYNFKYKVDDAYVDMPNNAINVTPGQNGYDENGAEISQPTKFIINTQYAEDGIKFWKFDTSYSLEIEIKYAPNFGNFDSPQVTYTIGTVTIPEFNLLKLETPDVAG